MSVGLRLPEFQGGASAFLHTTPIFTDLGQRGKRPINRVFFGEKWCYALGMGIPGRRPILDLEKDEVVIRKVREKVRFDDRPDLRGLARELGFKSHRNLYFVAERYEAAKGLRPDQREAPPASTE